MKQVIQTFVHERRKSHGFEMTWEWINIRFLSELSLHYRLWSECQDNLEHSGSERQSAHAETDSFSIPLNWKLSFFLTVMFELFWKGGVAFWSSCWRTAAILSIFLWRTSFASACWSSAAPPTSLMVLCSSLASSLSISGNRRARLALLAATHIYTRA